MATVGTTCLNCGAALDGPFCARCGQKAVHPKPTLHELLHDALEEFLHFDGKIVQTLRTLVTRPGQLTVDVVSGRRARYIAPLRLYLTVSVLFFAWNLWRSLRHGLPAGNDPWDGQTLEWATTSPPPERNFDSLPPIRSERPFFDQKYGDLVDAAGKAGNARAQQISQLSTRPLGVKEVINPLRASGGADPESRDQVRCNAPIAVTAVGAS